MSSGVQNLVKLVGGWVVALGVVAFAMFNFDDLRTHLGLKLSPADLGVNEQAVQPKPEPEVRTVIKYIERPVKPDDDDAQPQRRQKRPTFGPSVELTRLRDGHFHAEAYVNGRPISVLVDTGATLVVLTYEDARAAGVPVSDADFIHWSNTANGRARFASVKLDDVRIGDVIVRNVAAAVSEPGRLQKTLLGMSFLNQTRMQMQGAQLVLEQN